MISSNSTSLNPVGAPGGGKPGGNPPGGGWPGGGPWCGGKKAGFTCGTGPGGGANDRGGNPPGGGAPCIIGGGGPPGAPGGGPLICGGIPAGGAPGGGAPGGRPGGTAPLGGGPPMYLMESRMILSLNLLKLKKSQLKSGYGCKFYQTLQHPFYFVKHLINSISYLLLIVNMIIDLIFPL